MVRKNPAERKAELLVLSRSLFLKHGYEAVTVAAILQAANLSKGGLYHHFDSKDDILREIIQSEFADLAEQIEQLIEQRDPLNALIGIFHQGSAYLNGDSGILTALSTFQSRQLYLDVIEQAIDNQIKPALIEVIQLGIAANVFSAVHPSATAEILMAVNNYGNRKTVLQQWQQPEQREYNRTSFHLLGVYLGIPDQINELIEQMEEDS